MKQTKARMRLKNYLKERNIYFEESVDEISGKPINTVTMVFTKNVSCCPQQIVEACVLFYQDGMEVRCYYSELASNICKESRYKSELCRLMNYINATVFVFNHDYAGGSFYSSQYLHATRFYVSEDGFYDILVSSLIHYDWFEICSLETLDFITVALPEILNHLAISIFLLLDGKMTLEEAMAAIEMNEIDRIL